MFESLAQQIDDMLIESDRKKHATRRYSPVLKPRKHRKKKKKKAYFGFVSQKKKPLTTNGATPENNAADHAKQIHDSKTPEEQTHEKSEIKNGIKDLQTNPQNASKNKHLALYVGLGAVAALGLGAAFVASPALGIYVGSKIIESAVSSDNVGRLLDHLTGKAKEDRDETHEEQNNNAGSANNPHRDSDENGHPDNIMGDGEPETVSRGASTYAQSPDVQKVAQDAVAEYNKKAPSSEASATTPNMAPVDEHDKEKMRAEWAKRAEDYDKKSRDSNLTEEQRQAFSAASETASRINLAPPHLQKTILDHHNNKTNAPILKQGNGPTPALTESKQANNKDNNNEEEDENYDNIVDHVLSSGKVNVAAIKKETGLDDETIAKHIKQMQDDELISPPDKKGNHKVLVTPDEYYDDEEDDDDGDDEPPKGSKVQSALNNIQMDGLFQPHPFIDVLALLNFRFTQPGHWAGQNDSDEDKLGKGVLQYDYGLEKETSNPTVDDSILGPGVQQYSYASTIGTQNVPTYAALKLHQASARLLRSFMLKQGVKNVYPKGEFHITVCYSKKPISYKPINLANKPRMVEGYKFDLLGKDPDKQYLVLKLKKGFPHERFAYAQSVGASHDFPDYLPHISIAEPGHGLSAQDVARLNINGLPPLLIDHEFVDVLKDD